MNSVPLALKAEKPVRWTAPAIGEVCRLINGRTYKQNELLDDGRYRVLRVGNFFTSKHWYFSDLELDDDKYCDEGDLLYAWSASFGPRIWSGEKTIYHYHIWKVEPDPAKVLRDFLFYFFEWDKELIRKEQGAGATMIHVSKGSMEARAIPLAPMEEQKRIVAVLDQAFAALDRARASPTPIWRMLMSFLRLRRMKLSSARTLRRNLSVWLRLHVSIRHLLTRDNQNLSTCPTWVPATWFRGQIL